MRDGSQRDNSLRRFRFGDGAEFLFVELRNLQFPGPCRVHQRFATRGVDQLGRDEQAGDRQRRTQEFLRGADAFDHEQAFAFAGFPALEIPGEGQEAHADDGRET